MMNELKKDEEKVALDRIAKNLNERFRKQSSDEDPFVVVAADIADRLKPQYIETNVPALNQRLGGGIPKGSICVFTGQEGAGKTATALSVASKVQESGGYVLFINAEGGSIGMHADLVGLDLERTFYVEARDYAEQLVDVVDAYLYDKEKHRPLGLIGCVIIDSLNGLVPKAVVDKLDTEGSEGVPQMARRAKLIDDLLSRLVGRGMLRRGCVVLIIAQQRANLSQYGPTSVLSGGYSVKYFPKIRVSFNKAKRIEDPKTGVSLGHIVRFDVEKNNVNGKMGKGEYGVVYGIGIDDTDMLWEKALEWGFIVRRKSYFIITPEGDIPLSSRKPNALDEIRANKVLETILRDLLKNGQPKEPPVSTGKVREVEKVVVEQEDSEQEGEQ